MSQLPVSATENTGLRNADVNMAGLPTSQFHDEIGTFEIILSESTALYGIQPFCP